VANVQLRQIKHGSKTTVRKKQPGSRSSGARVDSVGFQEIKTIRRT
jgi:hypothetical protein